MDCFNLITRNLKVEDFVRTYSALLDKAVAAYNDEELPFCIMPMLAFCHARFTDIDAYLAAVQSVDELSE